MVRLDTQTKDEGRLELREKNLKILKPTDLGYDADDPNAINLGGGAQPMSEPATPF